MFNPLFLARDPLKALVTVVDVRLQPVVFAGELSTKACVNMQITLRFGKATDVSKSVSRNRRRRMLTFLVSADNTVRDTCRQEGRGLGDRARKGHGCRESVGHAWRPTSRQAIEAHRKPYVARGVHVQE